MTVERLIKRTVWECKCTCGKMREVKENDRTRSHLCPCGTWFDYKEVIAIGPDLNLPGYQ